MVCPLKQWVAVVLITNNRMKSNCHFWLGYKYRIKLLRFIIFKCKSRFSSLCCWSSSPFRVSKLRRTLTRALAQHSLATVGEGTDLDLAEDGGEDSASAVHSATEATEALEAMEVTAISTMMPLKNDGVWIMQLGKNLQSCRFSTALSSSRRVCQCFTNAHLDTLFLQPLLNVLKDSHIDKKPSGFDWARCEFTSNSSNLPMCPFVNEEKHLKATKDGYFFFLKVMYFYIKNQSTEYGMRKPDFRLICNKC